MEAADPIVEAIVIQMSAPFRSFGGVPRALLGMAFGTVGVRRRGTDDAKLSIEGLLPVSGPGGYVCRDAPTGTRGVGLFPRALLLTWSLVILLTVFYYERWATLIGGPPGIAEGVAKDPTWDPSAPPTGTTSLVNIPTSDPGTGRTLVAPTDETAGDPLIETGSFATTHFSSSLVFLTQELPTCPVVTVPSGIVRAPDGEVDPFPSGELIPTGVTKGDIPGPTRIPDTVLYPGTAPEWHVREPGIEPPAPRGVPWGVLVKTPPIPRESGGLLP